VLHSERKRPIETITADVVYFVFGVVITMIALRFVLLLFGANPEAVFSQLVYTLSALLMAPFFAVFGTTTIEGAVFEWSALLAIAVYALLAWGIVALIDAVTPRATAGTIETMEEVRDDSVTEQESENVGRDTYPVEDDRHAHPGGGTVVHH